MGDVHVLERLRSDSVTYCTRWCKSFGDNGLSSGDNSGDFMVRGEISLGDKF